MKTAAAATALRDVGDYVRWLDEEVIRRRAFVAANPDHPETPAMEASIPHLLRRIDERRTALVEMAECRYPDAGDQVTAGRIRWHAAGGVEVGRLDDGSAAVRHTDRPADLLVLTAGEWSGFAAAVRDGAFDR